MFESAVYVGHRSVLPGSHRESKSSHRRAFAFSRSAQSQSRRATSRKATRVGVHAHAAVAQKAQTSTSADAGHRAETIETDMVVIGSGIGGELHFRAVKHV